MAGARVGLLPGRGFVVNPTVEEQAESSLDLVMAGTSEAVLMIEGFCDFLSEEQMVEVGAAAALVGCCACCAWCARDAGCSGVAWGLWLWRRHCACTGMQRTAFRILPRCCTSLHTAHCTLLQARTRARARAAGDD